MHSSELIKWHDEDLCISFYANFTLKGNKNHKQILVSSQLIICLLKGLGALDRCLHPTLKSTRKGQSEGRLAGGGAEHRPTRCGWSHWGGGRPLHDQSFQLCHVFDIFHNKMMGGGKCVYFKKEIGIQLLTKLQ